MGQGKRPKEVKSNITDNESGKMLTSKGTIQGFNGVAAVDKKHQIIVEAQAFGEGQEHHTLKPILEGIKMRFERIKVSRDILADGVIITADTGFANEKNNLYLRDSKINAYIPDNQFRSRDKRFGKQKNKYGKRHQDTKIGIKQVIPASEFKLNQRRKTCVCPAGNALWLKNEVKQSNGNIKLAFEGKLTDCRSCALKQQCMRNPESPNDRTDHGRQVSFTLDKGKSATQWMKKRVDSQLGKKIYGHRMSVVEPVFGNIGTNKGLNRFTLRSKEKVQGQWRLFSLVHNIEKIKNYGDIAA